MVITYPLLTVVDDSGAIVAGATVTIASVTDKAGSAISSPGASVNQAGPNVSVDYDAEAKGEAWVTLAVSKMGSTFTGVNAAPAFYLSKDPSKIETALPNAGAGSTGGLPIGDASGRVVLQPTGLNAVAGYGAWSFPQSLRALVAFVAGKRTGVPAPGVGGTVTFTQGTSGDYGTIAVDTAGNITANAMTPPA